MLLVGIYYFFTIVSISLWFLWALSLYTTKTNRAYKKHHGRATKKKKRDWTLEGWPKYKHEAKKRTRISILKRVLEDAFVPTPTLNRFLSQKPTSLLDSFGLLVPYVPQQHLSLLALSPYDTGTAFILPQDKMMSTSVSIAPRFLKCLNLIINFPQSACHQLSPDNDFTMTEFRSISITLMSFLNSVPDIPVRLSLCAGTFKGIDQPSLKISVCQAWDQTLMLPALRLFECKEEFLALPSTEMTFDKDLTEPTQKFCIFPEVLRLVLEFVQRGTHFLLFNDKEKMSFGKHFSGNLQLDFSVKVSTSTALAVCIHFCNIQGKANELQLYEAPLFLKSMQDHSQKNYEQFWSLICPQSDCLPAIHGSGYCDSYFIFTKTLNECTGIEYMFQHTAHSAASSSSLPPKTKYGGCQQRPQNELVSRKAIIDQPWRVRAVVQRSVAYISPLPPRYVIRRTSQVNSLMSTLPGEFLLSNDLRKKLEYHLQKMLYQHKWDLLTRIFDSEMPLENFSEFENNTGLSHSTIIKEFNDKDVNVRTSQGKPLAHAWLSLTGNTPKGTERNLFEKQIQNIPKTQLNKDLEKKFNYQLPNTIHTSGKAQEDTLFFHERCITQKSQTPLGDQAYAPTAQRVSVVGSKEPIVETQTQILYPQRFAPKTLNSFGIMNLNGIPSHSAPPSRDKMVPGEDSKCFRKCFQGDGLGIKVTTQLDTQIPATLVVDSKNLEAPRQVPLAKKHILVNNLWTIKDVSSHAPFKTNMVGEENQRGRGPLINGPPCKIPTKTDEGRQASSRKAVSSGTTVDMLKTEKHFDSSSKPQMSGMRLRTAKLCTLPSNLSGRITNTKTERPQLTSWEEKEGKPLMPQLVQPSFPNQQICEKLKLKLRGKGNNKGQPEEDMFHSSDSMIYEENADTYPLLQTHSEETKFTRAGKKKPWSTKRVLQLFQKNHSSATKKMIYSSTEEQKLCAEDTSSSYETSSITSEYFHSQSQTVEGTAGSEASQNVQKQGLSHLKKCFNKMKRFVRSLCPVKRQGTAEEMEIILSPPESPSPLLLRTTPTRKHAYSKLLPAFGEQGIEACYSISAPFLDDMTNIKNPETVVADQRNYKNDPQIRDQEKLPQQNLTNMDQLVNIKPPPTVSSRRPKPHPGFPYRSRHSQGPPDAVSTAEGTVFRYVSTWSSNSSPEFLGPENKSF